MQLYAAAYNRVQGTRVIGEGAPVCPVETKRE
jgi:hypothetical protein